MEYVTAAGVPVPALGFGTAGMDTDEERKTAIAAALDAGYRHIDTAQMYDSESAVGDAIAESAVAREEVFVTTKLSRENRDHESAIDSTHESLRKLQLDSVDLLLIHSPDQEVAHEETLDAMNQLVAEGAVRHIGVSNFSVGETKNAIEGSDAPILTNQVEYNLEIQQNDLLSYCVDENVMLTAYSPIKLDNFENEILAEVAEAHEKTPRQVAIRWLLDQPMVSTIPRSANPDHIAANFDVFDFSLSDEEMRRLFEIGGGLDETLASQLGL